ncbi:hypothetical protein FRX31_029130 [Thalictrum thalictroides]|uniref:Uncharacterized protein n=1 Tax=Thalictrum thalictroides TaxID=46969 RepID=A0A7J6V834_THATH|nr:hypothetical protein FRX31_029130 [Thalictrum thalictroides]
MLKLYTLDIIVDLLGVWPLKTENALMAKVWNFLPYVVPWVEWKHRNEKMKQEGKGLIWFWCGNWTGRRRYRSET